MPCTCDYHEYDDGELHHHHCELKQTHTNYFTRSIEDEKKSDYIKFHEKELRYIKSS